MKLILLCLIVLYPLFAFSQQDSVQTDQHDANAIADKLNNPTSAIGSLTGFIDFKTYKGDLPNAGDQTSWSFTFQPSLPKPLKGGKNLLFRPAIPLLLKQPSYNGTDFENAGVNLGDIGFDLAIGSTSDKGFLFLAGLVGSLPTATSKALRGQWAFGPEVAIGKVTKKYVLGALISQKWDIESGTDKTNVLAGQYFYFFPIGNGRSLGASPLYQYDWETEELTFPIGMGYSAVTAIGSTPFKYGIQVFYFAATPDLFGPIWQIRIQLTPVVNLPW